MQFDNTQKITQLQRSNVDFITQYLNNYILTSRYARHVLCEATFDEGEYECDFILECDGFFAIIQYDSFETLSASLDIKLVYHGSDYRFSVYDIFNLFDINDFKHYYYDNCIDSTTIEKVLDELTAMIEKYGIDFKKAGSGLNLTKLKKNFEADQKLKNGESWQEIMEDESFDGTHIKYMFVTASSTEKLIEKLEKHSDKLCLYERRLLDYLRSGNEAEGSDLSDIDRIFKRTRRIVNIPLLIISFGLVALLQFVLTKTLLNGAFVPTVSNVDIFGYELPISMKWVELIGAGIMLFAFLSLVLGRWIIRKIIPDIAKSYANAKYAINGDETTFNRLRNRVLIPLGALVLTAAFFIGANVGIAFYDDYVIDCYLPTSFEHISYDEISLYEIENDDDGEAFDAVCYAVDYGKNYAVFAPCRQGSKADNKIKEIAKSHGKSITILADKDELAEAFENK